MQTSRALLEIPPKADHAAYSVNIAIAQGMNREILVIIRPNCILLDLFIKFLYKST